MSLRFGVIIVCSPNNNAIQSGDSADFKKNRDERVERPILTRIPLNPQTFNSDSTAFAHSGWRRRLLVIGASQIA
jgi:hypothetical protein